MSKQHLSQEDLQQILELVKAGITPEEIAQKFGVAVSTIHYHKARWKKEGLSMPIIRGKRPQGIFERLAESVPNGFSGVIGIPVEIGQNLHHQHKETQEDGAYKFVINGTSVTIDKSAKSVEVFPDKIIVNF